MPGNDHTMPFLWSLYQELRRRQFALTPTDFLAMRDAMRAGFGWGSMDALQDLCIMLWAKSRHERETVTALFDQLAPPELILLEWQSVESEIPGDVVEPVKAAAAVGPIPDGHEGSLEIRASSGLPPIPGDLIPPPPRPYVFSPIYPLGFREVAQTWRRLRLPVREGPPVELDIGATIARRSASLLATPPVQVARRRNAARLLLLVDRQGSMAPFHGFVEEVCAALSQAGRMKRVAQYYFHDVPSEGADESVLEALSGQLFPSLDPILSQIRPLDRGSIYTDSCLLTAIPVKEVLRRDAEGAFAVIISDAGAARGRYDLLRLLDTVAFLKALKKVARGVVWLNPLPKGQWSSSTASRIARHIPMFYLDRAGQDRAVNVLRGRPFPLARAL